jgi:hypothetical protein
MVLSLSLFVLLGLMLCNIEVANSIINWKHPKIRKIEKTWKEPISCKPVVLPLARYDSTVLRRSHNSASSLTRLPRLLV